jgi:hypothetical protein
MLTLFWTGFKLGSEKHTVEVVVNSDGDAKVTSGVSELSLLKTTQVEFSPIGAHRLMPLCMSMTCAFSFKISYKFS